MYRGLFSRSSLFVPTSSRIGRQCSGMNSAKRGVERHLSDGDAHAARALIAESENSFPVAEHDAFHIVVARMPQNLGDAILIRDS